jgi:hypothetical protein
VASRVLARSLEDRIAGRSVYVYETGIWYDVRSRCKRRRASLEVDGRGVRFPRRNLTVNVLEIVEPGSSVV